MSKFKKILIDKKRQFFLNINYLPQVIILYEKFYKYLNDDYFLCKDKSFTDAVLNAIEHSEPYFWVITTEKDKFAGFVFLDNLVGTKGNLHSAEVTTCILPEFWGKFTKICAKKFIKYCFKKYNLKKIKACIFPQNQRVRAILKQSGFKKEGLLRSETMRSGKLQDVEIFAVINGEKCNL